MSGNKAAWLPFSTGPRGCIGKPYVPILISEAEKDERLALMEIKKCISVFVWCLDAELAEADQKEPEYRDSFGVERTSLFVRIKRVQ